MYELPYGNTQQLNLDWFIKRWQEFYAQWQETEAGIDHALDAEVQRVEDAMTDLYAARDAAAASATAAAASAASANNDATIAANAATAAAASATLANTKATAAGLSEAAAALSASQAANDATAAATSASQASASASSATDSAQAAAASATAADSSADDAADSATAAAGSATAAAGSASDAADSATAAAASAASLVVDSAMSDSSTNPVQNKVINGELTELKTAIDAVDFSTHPVYVDMSRRADGAPSTVDIGSVVSFGTQGYWQHLVLNRDADFLLGDTFRIVHQLYNENYYYVLYTDANNVIVARDCQGTASQTIARDIVTVPNNEAIAHMVLVTYSGSNQVDRFNACRYAPITPPDWLSKSGTLVYVENPILENGNISISGSGWSYSDHNERARTPQGVTFRCEAGDTISFSDYTKIRYYLGWRTDKGIYQYNGWLSRDFTVEVSGDYVLLVELIPSSRIERLNEINEMLTVIHYTPLASLPSVKPLKARTHIFDLKKCRTIAHAGIALSGLVENVKSSFEASAKAGAWALETDIIQTSDGYYVCCHDVMVDEVTTSTGLISNYTLAELQAMTMKIRGTETTIADHFCDFREFLDICRIYGCIAIIELKVPQTYDGQTIDPQYNYENIANEILSRGLEKQCALVSFYGDRPLKIREFTDDVAVGFISEAAPDNSNSGRLLMENDGNGGMIISQSATFDKDYITDAHKNGLFVFTYTSYNNTQSRDEAVANIPKLIDGVIAEAIVDILAYQS